MKTPISLDKAQILSSAIIKNLSHYCERIEVVGSVRRQRDNVGDIELLLIPRKVEVNLMDFGSTVNESDYRASIKNAIPKMGEIIVGGRVKDWRLIRFLTKSNERFPPVQVELYVTNRDSWGYMQFIRTGDKDFSHQLKRRLSYLGYVGYSHFKNKPKTIKKGYLHTKLGVPVIVRNEHDLFDLAKLPYIDPIDRNLKTLKEIECYHPLNTNKWS